MRPHGRSLRHSSRHRRPSRAAAIVAAASLAALALAAVAVPTLMPRGSGGEPASGEPAGAEATIDGAASTGADTPGQFAALADRDADAGERPGELLAASAGSHGEAPLLFTDAPITVATDGFLSWAVLDRRTGELWGSANLAETTWPASMIKAWIAADFLRRASAGGATPSAATLGEVEIMIRDSDNGAAIRLHSSNGGSESIRRMISMCGLTDTSPSLAGGWSFTNISARDAVRVGDCIADGVAGPRWTAWLMDQMRSVRIGDWGIRDGVPPGEADRVSIKNGWLRYDDDGLWHINCLAVADTWAMSVLQRYRGTGNWERDFASGRERCRDVAIQLINPAYPYGTQV